MYSSLNFTTFLLLRQQKKGPALRRVRGPIASVRTVGSAARGPNLAVLADDVEQPLGRVLDLQRRVVDLEPLVEQGFQLLADAMAVLATADQDVGREGGEAGADLPDM